MNENYPPEHQADGDVRQPRLTVIIVNHESWSDVLELTGALQAQPEFSSGRVRIVVVDNASRGGRLEFRDQFVGHQSHVG